MKDLCEFCRSLQIDNFQSISKKTPSQRTVRTRAASGEFPPDRDQFHPLSDDPGCARRRLRVEGPLRACLLVAVAARPPPEQCRRGRRRRQVAPITHRAKITAEQQDQDSPVLSEPRSKPAQDRDRRQRLRSRAVAPGYPADASTTPRGLLRT